MSVTSGMAPQAYRTPMDDPASRARILSGLQERAAAAERQRSEDPVTQIILEAQRRKAAGLGPAGMVEAGLTNAAANEEYNKMMERLLNPKTPAAPPPSGRFAGDALKPENPFSHEPQEYQDLMRRLGVIQ